MNLPPPSILLSGVGGGGARVVKIIMVLIVVTDVVVNGDEVYDSEGESGDMRVMVAVMSIGVVVVTIKPYMSVL